MTKLNSLIQKLKASEILDEINVVKSHDLVGDIAFRVEFGFPVFIMLSHPICKFMSRRNYPIREGSYIANMGLVPVFFSSMNTMSLLIMYDERTEGFFSPINSPLSDTEIICWELPVAARPAIYSSMNFILQNGSEATIAERFYEEACVKYFDYGYWSSPLPGFIPSTHFLHGRKQVTCIVKVAKSLLTVDEIGPKRMVTIEGHQMECREVGMNILMENEGSYYFKRYDALMDAELAEKLEEERRVRSGFINAMISELHYTGGHRAWILTVIAEYGDSYFELLQSLIGMVASKQYYKSESVATLGTIGGLRENVYNAFLDIKRKIHLPVTLSDYISNSFDLALGSMFPMIIVDNQDLYYAHPLILGFLKKWNLIGPDDKSNREMITRVVKLLEKIQEGTYMKIYLSAEADFFQKRGIPKNAFISNLMRIGKLINMTKLINTTWTQFSEQS